MSRVIDDDGPSYGNFWTDVTPYRTWGWWPNYSSTPMTIGTWYHLAWTFDGSTIHMYQDSVEVASVTGAAVAIDRSGNFTIGNGKDGSPIGIIDDVRLFTAALTPAEISTYASRPVV